MMEKEAKGIIALLLLIIDGLITATGANADTSFVSFQDKEGDQVSQLSILDTTKIAREFLYKNEAA